MRRRGLKAIAAAMILSAVCVLGSMPALAEEDQAAAEEVQTAAAEDEDQAAADEDQATADEVAALIDAIYVQERTLDTDKQCAQAKAAWDALTEEQKELVEGEEADPDYFGRDTGDASLDDPRNENEIGENELLVVSFGTSFNDSRAEDIRGIEDALAAAYPDWSVRRAFTAQIIINHVQARDGEFIDNMDQALTRAVDNGVKNLVVQPTHLMHGAEYDELVEAVEEYADQFETIVVAEPLLGEVGEDASVINDDKAAVAETVVAAAVESSEYDSLEEMADDGCALVLMGHGTAHSAKVTYSQMQTQMETLGYDNVFIGTVEGEPEETSCENVIAAVSEAGYTKVILRPLMVVAGDHANNDMAGDDEDSWKSQFEDSGLFTSVETQIAGLGRIPAIQDLYVAHTAAALEEIGESGTAEEAAVEEPGKDSTAEEAAAEEPGTDGVAEEAALPDGVYTVDFDTDSSMFHINEALDGKATLTVEDGQMTVHITLVSKNILNLYYGLAEDAGKDGAVLIEPTEDTVTYSDGTTEEVYGFDVPVPALDEEFDLALIGEKGTWYDHKVSVSNPVPESAEPELADGTYFTEITLSGGSGRASVESPAELSVADGEITATVTFSSPNYDYMLIGDQRYEPVNTEGNSTFEIPVAALDEEFPVIADTTAMSEPHEIEYTLYFDAATLTDADEAAGAPEAQAAEDDGQSEVQAAGTAEAETAGDAGAASGEIAALGEDWCGLTWERSLDLSYATQFAVDYYEGGYARIVIADTDVYLLVPEGEPVPEDAAEPDGPDADVVVLQQPLQNIDLLATSAMDFFCSLDALDAIRLTGTEPDGWYIEEAREAMEEGRILYAGKYSAPDYEMLLSEDCGLAIESTMIYHTPEVKEELEALGIPVLVERSSYEDHPLGRMEWIKFYAVLLGLEEEAEELFDAEAAPVAALGEEDPLGKTVVFFYIQSDGIVNVRRPNDYISKMIEMAGGTYLFQDLNKEDSTDTAISMTVEEFYSEAKDADFLIYNSTTGGELYTTDELLDLSPLLADFKAVQEGNAWCTGKNLFQETMSIGDAIYQMHMIFSEEDPDPAEITYLHRLN